MLYVHANQPTPWNNASIGHTEPSSDKPSIQPKHLLQTVSGPGGSIIVHMFFPACMWANWGCRVGTTASSHGVCLHCLGEEFKWSHHTHTSEHCIALPFSVLRMHTLETAYIAILRAILQESCNYNELLLFLVCIAARTVILQFSFLAACTIPYMHCERSA